MVDKLSVPDVPQAAGAPQFQEILKNLLMGLGEPMMQMLRPENASDFVQGLGGTMLATMGPMAGKGVGRTATEAARTSFPDLRYAMKQLLATAEPAASEDAIAKVLAKNPGASIFDLVGGKSDPEPSPFYTYDPKHLKELPVDVNWKLPDAARAAGFNTPVFHGTNTPKIFSEFKLPSDEIGVHFGTPRAAHEIQGPTSYYDKWTSDGMKATAPRIYPTVIKAEKPLRLPDLGSWGPERISNALVKHHPSEFPQDEVDSIMTNGSNWAYVNQQDPSYGQTKHLRDYIKSKGYDSIIYQNSVEHAGSDSYIKFDPSPTEPKYARDVRSPFANFDPLKKDLPNILAGLGGGAVLPWLGDSRAER